MTQTNMNQYNYNQPDGREEFVRFIEMFSPMMKAQGESILRSISANSYSSNFNTLMNILNGKMFISTINSKTIDNAAEYYKQCNKALLYFRSLNEVEKKRESNEIDFETNRLKDDWYFKLRQMQISII